MLSRSNRRRPDRAGNNAVADPNSSLPPPPPPPVTSSPPSPPLLDHSTALLFPHISTGIYAAPTVDTLDETVVSSRMNPHLSATTSSATTTTMLHASSRLEPTFLLLPNVATKPPSLDHDNTPLQTNIVGSQVMGAPPPMKNMHLANAAITMEYQSQQPPPFSTQRESTKITTIPNSKVPRDFHREEDAMRVTIQKVNIAQRSAFDLQRAPSIAYWHSVAHEAERNLLATSPVLLSRSGIRKKRLSPSFQHLLLLHKMQSITSIQQLNFSPSVGLEADPFVPWDDDLLSDSQKQQPRDSKDDDDDNKESDRRGRRRRQQKRDGRYRSIHPVNATLAQLPSTPPFVSNKKMRLPSRADVGFCNPTPEEVARKHQEIIHETEWEEASPRLIVLIPSDDIGTFVPSEKSSYDLPRLLPECGLHFGLEGMPWAGPELIIAKERNARHFGGSTKQQPTHERLFFKRTSVLAPPLDASYSSTLGWRPRPFHDRHPGVAYCLASCIQVEFDAGNLEPILASLTLYSLPPATKQSSSTGEAAGAEPKRKLVAYGKMSEEFYFPAGDWRGKVELDLARLGDKDDQMDPDLLESFHRRKHKALFSYDSQSLSGGKQSLHVVLQLYKVTHADALGAYTTGIVVPKGERRSTLRSRIKDKLKGKSSSSGVDDNLSVPPSLADMTSARANAAFVNYGTQFLTPLGFGVIPLYKQETSGDDDSPMSWPKGETRNTPIFAFPSVPESQDEFVERLSLAASMMFEKEHPQHLSAESELPNGVVASSTSEPALDPMRSSSTLSTMSLTSSADSITSVSPTPSKKVGVARRIFQTPRKQSALAPMLLPTDRRIKDGSQTANKEICPLGARASVFVSELEIDFLQSMLYTPPALDPGEGAKQGLPKLLVDISGDSAIMLNPSSNERNRKRSSLVRLPFSEVPCGYAEASEIREVLHLPPRLDKQYDVDSPPPFRAILNLLYLYPRLIRLFPAESKADEIPKPRKESCETCRYTVRVRLVQNSLALDNSKEQVESLNKSLEAFHNPAPWAGPPMLHAVYTKVSGSRVGSRNNHAESLKHGIPMKDEIKMRLPSVLDGTYYLQFTLFAVELTGDVPDDASSSSAIDEGLGDDCILSVTVIAESTIPLSSATRDSTSGTRVTTIIPNGCHRLKLGEFQLHLETRVVSSIHVGDPAVATALRDFPIAQPEFEDISSDSYRELALVPSRSIVGRSTKNSNPIVDLKLPYTALFAASSDSALLGHFHLILFMHFCNMVNHLSDSDSVLDDPPSPQFLLDNMRSLFEVLRKVKKKLRSLSSLKENQRRVDKFLKISLDSFDEGLISSDVVESVDDDSTDGIVDQVHLDRSRSNHSANNVEDDQVDDDADDPRDEGAVRLRNKDSIRHGVDVRISKSVSAIGAAGIPFLRVAYGVAETGRKRIESDFSGKSVGLTHLFDDDVTVATALLSLTDAPKVDTSYQESITQSSYWGITEDTTVISDEDTLSILRPHQLPSIADDTKRPHKYLGGSGLAKRVRTAAQVMLAPCVAPSLSAILTPRSHNKDKQKIGDKKTIQGFGYAAAACLCSPGSDVDNEGVVERNVVGTDKGTPSKANRIPISREQNEDKITAFTVDSIMVRRGLSVPMGIGKFLYESIIVLWVHAWFDFLEEITDDNGPGDLNGSDSVSQSLSLLDFSAAEGSTIHCFFVHTDALLPICLKSFVLRCCKEVTSKQPVSQKAIVDENHTLLLTVLVEILARGLMGAAMSGTSQGKESDLALAKALTSAQTVLEFFIGLFSVLHQGHMFVLLGKYFRTLRDCETELLVLSNGKYDFSWTEETLQRVKSARQLRLRAVEKFAVLPNFLALNHPLTFLPRPNSSQLHSTSFSNQSSLDEEQLRSNAQSTTDLTGDPNVLPNNGWLANLLSNECLSICALSSEVVVAEAIAQLETESRSASRSPSNRFSELRKRPGASLKRDDLLMFQSIAIHSITCLHELIFRRHSMDERFQREKSRGQIATLFAPSLFEKSLGSVRWLARMEATHKVRSLWLLCFVYLLQELPETLMKDFVRTYCNPKNFRIHRFIRLLRLSSSTFQSFIEQPRRSKFPPEIEECISPWLLQESFNTICATIIIVVDECVSVVTKFPREQQTMMQGILDLLLHILTTPQSSVVHLRAVGGAIHALEQFGVNLFTEIAGDNLQHWIRIMLSLMNSMSLSVRSIAVDFVVSLLASAYRSHESIDETTTVFLTVLPEVVAREIALCSVSGLVSNLADVETSVWPIRRAIADIEDASPLDDDRVDPQLVPLLSVFCRACQAVIDGVLIELRMKDDKCQIVGIAISVPPKNTFVFDADEESLLEAANFFDHENGPVQRIRWLLTLTSLHEAKGQWLEAAEALVLCARTAADSILHVRHVWRPSHFVLWSDSRRSQWLSTVGEDLGFPDRGNAQVMEFAGNFLEPTSLLGISLSQSTSDRLAQPTVSDMCAIFASCIGFALKNYSLAKGLDSFVHVRLRALLDSLTQTIDQCNNLNIQSGMFNQLGRADEEAALQQLSAHLNEEVVKLSQRLSTVATEGAVGAETISDTTAAGIQSSSRFFYVCLCLTGRKTRRFLESTTIPTFLEWDQPCICRVPGTIITTIAANGEDDEATEERICREFGLPFSLALAEDYGEETIIFRTGSAAHGISHEDFNPLQTVINVVMVHMSTEVVENNTSLESQRFFPGRASSIKSTANSGETYQPTEEWTVAQAFPCALSRQRAFSGEIEHPVHSFET